MRKLFVLSMMLGTLIFVVPSAEAKATAAVSADPQNYARIGQPRRRYRRVVTRTRITRIGRYRYRETIRITYLPNGSTRTRVISRVRLGRWNGRY